MGPLGRGTRLPVRQREDRFEITFTRFPPHSKTPNRDLRIRLRQHSRRQMMASLKAIRRSLSTGSEAQAVITSPTAAAASRGFAADPDAHPAPAEQKPAEPSAAAHGQGRWTCPMHPEIVRDGPGNCPICGMALEPVAISSDRPNPELA